jgi:hypothetical protein
MRSSAKCDIRFGCFAKRSPRAVQQALRQLKSPSRSNARTNLVPEWAEGYRTKCAADPILFSYPNFFWL